MVGNRTKAAISGAISAGLGSFSAYLFNAANLAESKINYALAGNYVAGIKLIWGVSNAADNMAYGRACNQPTGLGQMFHSPRKLAELCVEKYETGRDAVYQAIQAASGGFNDTRIALEKLYERLPSDLIDQTKNVTNIDGTNTLLNKVGGVMHSALQNLTVIKDSVVMPANDIYIPQRNGLEQVAVLVGLAAIFFGGYAVYNWKNRKRKAEQ